MAWWFRRKRDIPPRDIPNTPIRDPSEIQHADLRGLYDYWRAKAGDRVMPDRADIDPLEMVPWLPHLLLVEIDPGFDDVRFRLIGTWVADRVGRDDTGKTMRELGVTPSRGRIRDAYLDAARSAQACRRVGEFHDRSGAQQHLWAERLMLPMTRSGSQTAMILGAIYFLDVD